MLENRPYMRNPEFSTRPAFPMTILLIGVTLAVFVLQEVNAAYGRFPVLSYFALSTNGLSHGYLWQLLTFQFLHGGGLHLIFNLFGLYMFGRVVEGALGRRHLLWLYFGNGVAGGLLQAGLGFAFPERFGIPVVGASAGVFGLVAAYSMLEPDREILLFFVLPIRSKYFIWLAAGIAIFYILVPADPGVAHGAHLGGIIGGWAYIHWIIQGRLSFSSWRALRPRRRPTELVKVRAPKSAPWRAAPGAQPEELPPADFISKEVDPILEKISAHGIHSLTEKERKILEAARAKMQKR